MTTGNSLAASASSTVAEWQHCRWTAARVHTWPHPHPASQLDTTCQLKLALNWHTRNHGPEMTSDTMRQAVPSPMAEYLLMVVVQHAHKI